MKTVQEIYARYTIMPFLQTHMLRVSGVALLLCQNAKEKVPMENIVSACLLHDMGNIIKSDLSVFPESTKPQGMEYWEKVKKEYLEKYGTNEDEATHIIAKEIGVSEKTHGCLLSIGFSKSCENVASHDLSFQIPTYSDMRVAPYGVVSLKERLAEGHQRYAKSRRLFGAGDQGIYEKNWQCTNDLEQNIFSKNTLSPESITAHSVEPLLEDLKRFEIV